jgi:hypothetical protein
MPLGIDLLIGVRLPLQPSMEGTAVARFAGNLEEIQRQQKRIARHEGKAAGFGGEMEFP